MTSFETHLSEVYYEPNTGCWLWPGHVNDGHGYGITSVAGRQKLAHRASYEHHKGEIPDGLWVLHNCDVRSCVNPSHLRLGTHEDNMADMTQRGGRKGKNLGRGVGKGTSHPSAKLTDEQVYAIRSASGVNSDIALQHGVSSSLVSLIKTGKRWRHLPTEVVAGTIAGAMNRRR